jgi:hypothetical protein
VGSIIVLFSLILIIAAVIVTRDRGR